MYHLSPVKQEWGQEDLAPFNELILSWNGERPREGKYTFYVRLKLAEWSPWLSYAEWGFNEQKSFMCLAENGLIRVYQDAVEVLGGRRANGFQVRIDTEGVALIESLWSLHVYTNSEQIQQTLIAGENPLLIAMPGLSQMALTHPRRSDLCSPTSTTAVVRFLSDRSEVDPIHFAERVLDAGFNIFGNWVFNVAAASTELGPKWHCWVERLCGFGAIYDRLAHNTPVIVSVRGPLAGSAALYSRGHLIAVIGYDPSSQQVICMDPAFPSDETTHVRYPLQDFVQAWERRGKVAYLFNRWV
jgi:hypothetical protein